MGARKKSSDGKKLKKTIEVRSGRGVHFDKRKARPAVRGGKKIKERVQNDNKGQEPEVKTEQREVLGRPEPRGKGKSKASTSDQT